MYIQSKTVKRNKKAEVIYTVKMVEKLGFEMYAVVRCDEKGVKILKTCWNEGCAWNIVNTLREAQVVEKYKMAA